jgi:hypothetical protein
MSDAATNVTVTRFHSLTLGEGFLSAVARVHQLLQFLTATVEQHTHVLRWRIDFTDAVGHLGGSHSPEQAKISQATYIRLVLRASKGRSRQRVKAVAVGISPLTLCRHSAAGSAILPRKMCLPRPNFAEEGLVFSNI